MPGIYPVGAEAVREDSGDFDSAIIADSAGRRWRVRAPRRPDASMRLEAEHLMETFNADLAVDAELAASYTAAHAEYLARRAELGQVAEIEGVSAGGMPTRVKCLHALLGHTLAAGTGVNPIGDRTLEALRERGLWDPERCFC